MLLDHSIKFISECKRMGGARDFPEGVRFIVISKMDRIEMVAEAKEAQQQLGFLSSRNTLLARFIETMTPGPNSRNEIQISDTFAQMLVNELEQAKYLIQENKKSTSKKR